MKYKFDDGFIVATAETFQENAILLSTQGALPQVEAPKRKTRIGKGQQKTTHRSKKSELEPLKQKLDSISKGSTVFVPSDIANLTNDFPSFSHYWFTVKHGKHASVHKVEGGYNVAVK